MKPNCGGEFTILQCNGGGYNTNHLLYEKKYIKVKHHYILHDGLAIHGPEVRKPE